MNKFIAKTILPLVFTTILSGCGGANQPSTSANLIMTDFAFSPSTLIVPAGREISLTVTNNGAVAHDLMIMQLGYTLTSRDHVGEDAHANAYWEQKTLDSGATLRSTFTAPNEPGEYQIVCGVAGHLEAGMVGKLVVVPFP